MSDQHDPADTAEAQAIDRLERALDRIAGLARDVEAEAAHPGGAENLSVEELRSRLDQLISKLRATLATAGEAPGNGQQ